MKRKKNLLFSADLKRKIFLKRREISLALLFVLFLFYFFSGKKNLSKCPFGSEVLVTKVIDGDTVIIEGGYTVRLLGIDTDERGYPCYESAKEKLESLVLNRKVKLEKENEEVDQYGRCLGYLFLGNTNLNLKMVQDGEAICRFLAPNTKYQKECQAMEKSAMKERKGCKWKTL